MLSESGLSARDVVVGYEGKPVLHGVSISLHHGDAVAVIGPNGAGKSTLLNTLAGALKATSGGVSLDGVPLQSIARRDLAKRIAVVPQRLTIGFGLTGLDVVRLGRTPYLGRFGSHCKSDREAVDRAIEDTDCSGFAARAYSSLSGGEAQRIILAMALAQETSYLLLDEPTVHLDLGQQWKFMQTLVALRQARNVGILAVIHDLSLAGIGFDRVVLLAGGRIIADGTASEVITEVNVSTGFDAPVKVWQDGTKVRVVLDPTSSIVIPRVRDSNDA